MSDNNFGKCGPIFKILSPVDSQENSLCTTAKISFLLGVIIKRQGEGFFIGAPLTVAIYHDYACISFLYAG